VIRERRKFTEIMDEEINDERHILPNGTLSSHAEPKRVRNEIGARLDTLTQVEAQKAMRRLGSEPLFREKPSPVVYSAMGSEISVSVLVDGDPEPTVQFFK